MLINRSLATLEKRSDELTQETKEKLEQLEKTKNDIKSQQDKWFADQQEKLQKVDTVEYRLESAHKELDEKNKQQDQKVRELEKVVSDGKQTLTQMHYVEQTHQPSGQIKVEILGLLLHHKWPDPFKNKLAEAVRDCGANRPISADTK